MAEEYHELEEQSINVVQGEAPPEVKPVDQNSPEAIKQRRWVVSIHCAICYSIIIKLYV